MQLPTNVEKSAFREGYVAWDGMGQPWTVTRHARNKALWVARTAPNHRSRYLPPVQAPTLKELAAALAARSPAAALEPF